MLCGYAVICPSTSETILASEAPRIILDDMKEAGINLVASLPDINLAELLALIEEDEGITHVPACCSSLDQRGVRTSSGLDVTGS